MASPANWFFDIFSWDKLMAIFSIFAVLVSTAFIPVYHLYRNREQKKKDTYEKQHLERIDKAVKPLSNKIDLLEETQQETVRDIHEMAKNLDALTQEFHMHVKSSEDLHKKVYFMTGMMDRFRDKFGDLDVE